jgi:uncharacterized DUF497 family protein
MMHDEDIVYRDQFIWNRRKNEANIKKHRISFETASFIFDDPFHFEEYDPENSMDEDRFNNTGSATGLFNEVFMTVSVTYRGYFIRIISARDADPDEIRKYYENVRSITG